MTNETSGQPDDKFYDRADAFIRMANDQIGGKDGASADMVNASMIFATARFNAWMSATGFNTGAAMAAKREETVEYFVAGYRQMLEGNLDAYIRNFDDYMKSQGGDGKEG